MSSEAAATPSSAEFHAQRAPVTTERGTEVSPSRTGDRILSVANRVVGFLDRFKGTQAELNETAHDKVDQARGFLRFAGEKAVSTAIATGEFALGATVLGLEAVSRGATKVDRSIEQGARAFDDKVTEVAGYIDEGIDGGIAYAQQKGTELRERVVGGVTGGIDYVKQKGTDAKEAVLDRIEAFKAALKERATIARGRRDARHERWTARAAQSREAIDEAAKRGKRRVLAARLARKAAIMTYKVHTSPALHANS